MVRFRQDEAYETAIGFFLSSACWFVVAAFAGAAIALPEINRSSRTAKYRIGLFMRNSRIT